MIKYWYVTGDTHGDVYRRVTQIETPLEESALIILGDVGLNFYLNKTDYTKKRVLQNSGVTLYCVRGNHEARPEDLNYPLIYDDEVKGEVYCEAEFPNIRYFVDGGEYEIAGWSTLVIGGAYSVDKEYRLQKAAAAGSSFTGWFEHEQLTAEEMTVIEERVANRWFDMVLTHTCPLSWEPTDLFLPFVDQSKVDTTMEEWMECLSKRFTYGTWLWGHFHADRVYSWGRMFYYDIASIEPKEE